MTDILFYSETTEINYRFVLYKDWNVIAIVNTAKMLWELHRWFSKQYPLSMLTVTLTID